MRVNFLDLFAGIGGFRLALERAGHTCIGFCEIDKFARQTYKANFNTKDEVEWHDITKVTKEDLDSLQAKHEVDLITFGSPCQSFSVAGYRKGLEDMRGTLFFDALRIVEHLKPKNFLFENVKGLLSSRSSVDLEFIEKLLVEEVAFLDAENIPIKPLKEFDILIDNLISYSNDPNAKEPEIISFIEKQKETNSNFKKRFEKKKGDVDYYVPTFNILVQAIGEIGYDCEWSLLNSKHFGVPQNRERIFVVGHLRGASGREVFPITGEDAKSLRCVGRIDIKGNDSIRRVYDPKGLSPILTGMEGGQRQPKIAIPVLTPEREEKRQNGRRFKENGEPMFTLTSQDRHGVVLYDPYNQNLQNDQDNTTTHSNGNSWVIEKPPFIPGPNDINNMARSSGTSSLTAKHNHYHIHDGYRIRRLSPLETLRLQAFPDSFYKNAKKDGVSDSQIYKQAGNSVSVCVVEAIVNKLLD